jgi:hypothetical protein
MLTQDTMPQMNTMFLGRIFLLIAQANPLSPRPGKFQGQGKSSIKTTHRQIPEAMRTKGKLRPLLFTPKDQRSNRIPSTVVVRTTKRYSRNISAHEDSLTD